MNVRIEHANQMGIVSLLERKLGISTPFSDNDGKDGALEFFEVNNMLSWDSTITKSDSNSLVPPSNGRTHLEVCLGQEDPREGNPRWAQVTQEESPPSDVYD